MCVSSPKSPAMKIKTPAAQLSSTCESSSHLSCASPQGCSLCSPSQARSSPTTKHRRLRSSRWLTRLASTLGIVSRSQRGGAIKLDKYPAEHARRNHRRRFRIAARHRSAPGRGSSHREVAGHRADRSGDGSEICSSGTDAPEASDEKWRPGGADSDAAGARVSAPTPTGLSFDGVGVGLAGFSPSQ